MGSVAGWAARHARAVLAIAALLAIGFGFAATRIPTDAGLDTPRARMLAVGLVGLSQVAAQYWLDSDQAVPRDEAVALMSGFAWRGLAGFPLVHD